MPQLWIWETRINSSSQDLPRCHQIRARMMKFRLRSPRCTSLLQLACFSKLKLTAKISQMLISRSIKSTRKSKYAGTMITYTGKDDNAKGSNLRQKWDRLREISLHIWLKTYRKPLQKLFSFHSSTTISNLKSIGSNKILLKKHLMPMRFRRGLKLNHISI